MMLLCYYLHALRKTLRKARPHRYAAVQKTLGSMRPYRYAARHRP
jgi:hypothetical protein